ncbi:hydroxymethylglutaryl CoA reductase [Dictyostelium purpureum]|uniref:3-hydroxy-3-methylglutaryl coenzyme A reductase n=1 Tax=Dictyostelium purpureum TaxID=5786 RepID=F0ZUD9_DICPU|nr:hydroxymethylglutaryl CoA reductase [Dictyostelium purpureum]EGC32461.1 hydroxymethylglutaryl CoA reductase [Dictyostelium purpureum]|eukprot:XP_003291033.1 hydroxymethylglutaryl CoA reductase [Dictyostelium purpureum]
MLFAPPNFSETRELFWIIYILILIPKFFAKVMSVRELFPFFKWGFNIRRSNFLVPILSNNVIVTGEEAVQYEKPLPYKDLPPQIQRNLEQKEYIIQNDNNNKNNNISTSPNLESTSTIPQITPESTPTLKSTKVPTKELSNLEILEKVEKGEILAYKLESELGDCTRAVEIRRLLLEKQLQKKLETLPYQQYDFGKVQGQCCENVIGYVPIPVGAAGPILLNGQMVTIPMATTEGCLVASTHRGCKAISESGGSRCSITSRGMTRAPVVRFSDIVKAAEFVNWINSPENYGTLKEVFDSTSRFARLSNIKCTVAGRSVYIRFKCDTGDAMGMNMVSKGVEAVLDLLKSLFDDMALLSVSGNMCTDKKPSSINWIEGRGRSVVCEALITGDVVQKVLKTSVQALVDLNIAKNLVGSAMAGSIGGFNAHASNIVTAVFLATGQDCAQNVESSNCITQMEACNDGQDLYMTVTMPSIEVGTVGGGTSLPAQASCLDIIGVRGSIAGKPGANADQLAKTICAAVMAGELSLMAALSAGHLMKSHLQLNRAKSPPSTN